MSGQIGAMPDIISLGECMVELFSEEPIARAGSFRKAVGGDALNTLVAAARLGASTGFVTRVGDDPFAPFLLESWRAEGIDVSHARFVEGFNAVYFISLLPGGEREFTYYRSGSAASTMTPGRPRPRVHWRRAGPPRERHQPGDIALLPRDRAWPPFAWRASRACWSRTTLTYAVSCGRRSMMPAPPCRKSCPSPTSSCPRRRRR